MGVIICLLPTQWKELEPYLLDVVYETAGGPDEGFPTLEARIFPDEATYQKVLAIAKEHCPGLVKDIEKTRHYG